MAIPLRLSSLGVALALGAGCLWPFAAEAAVTFAISSVDLQLGAGYGTDKNKDKDNNEEGGTLLDVAFKASFTSKTFTLEAVDSAFSFDLGTVRLAEPDSHGGILPAETDDLGVSWIFHFTQPTVGSQPVTAVAVAEAGFIRDAGQYWLDWSPVRVDLGDGLSFLLSLNDLEAETKKPVMQTATITLLSLPTLEAPPPGASVPEPGTIGLFALGFAGIGAARRKKAAG
jgi:PEP-CTERM motif